MWRVCVCELIWWGANARVVGTPPTPWAPMSLGCDNQAAGDLAYNCWREYPRQVDPDLEAYILDVRCSKLEDYLKNQQWQKADRETSRVMLQTMGKEEDGYLISNDMENFPAAFLRQFKL